MIDPTAGAAANTHETVVTLLDPPDGHPILDVGAGRGNFTSYLEQRGYPVVAVGINPRPYLAARDAAAPFVICNIDDSLPFAAGSVSGIVMIEVLEHLEAPLRALRSAAAVLRLGGFLVLSTPNVMSLGSRLELLFRGSHEDFDDYAYRGNGHISPVSLVQIERMGERVGLSTEAVTYNLGKLPLPKFHHRYPLRASRWLNQRFGESLIVKMRKTGAPQHVINRG